MHGPQMGNGGRKGGKTNKGKPNPNPPARSGYKGVTKMTGGKRGKQRQGIFYHEGKVQYCGSFVTEEEAAWEHNLKHLDLGYEDEGFYKFRFNLQAAAGSGAWTRVGHSCRAMASPSWQVVGQLFNQSYCQPGHAECTRRTSCPSRP